MNIPIRVLIVEDSEDDTILIVRELKHNGFDVIFERVDNHNAMEDALTKQEWDIVIADYSMPKFDGMSALRLLEKKGHDLPFILVSGTIGEDVAVEAVKAGADDYIMKDNLTRLVSAVKRELNEYKNRRELKRMEEAIQTLVKSTVVKTGQDAFLRIGSGIRDWLGTDYVCLGQMVDDDKVKVLSMIVNGEFKCGCIYDLKGTLCDTVIKDGFYHCPEGAGELLPETCEQCSKIKVEGYVGTSILSESGKKIGLLWTASRNKLDLPPRAKEVMEIIATKAGSEIERMQVEEAIRALVKSMVGTTGQDFFDSVVESICEWLGADCAFIGQITNGDNVKALSMQLDGEIVHDYGYNLGAIPTPCGNVAEKGYCVYYEGVCKLFPDDAILSEMGAEGYVGTPLRDESGKPIGILWVVSRQKLNLPPHAKEVMEIIATKAASEIKRMRAEEQLHKLSHAVEESSSVVLITDIKGTIEYVNPMFTRQTGYTFEEAIGRNPGILKSGKTSRDEYKQLWETITSGKEWHGEFCNKKKNGELYWESASISPVKNKEGKITNFIAVKEDITDRKRMEETIRRHNEELESLVEERTTRIMELERQRMENEKLTAAGRMAARVAHEINNPLSGIKGGFMLVKDSIPKEHKYYQYVGLIEKEVDRIARIVKQMFNLSRPYQGKISEFDSIVTIRDVINMLKNIGDEHDVSLNFNNCNEIIKTTMSEDYFRQILINIIKNAIEASPVGGKVNVNVKNQDGRLKTIVSDQGSGISDELRSKIFEPFFTTKDKYSGSGMGLGLSTTKVIVESMGGTLDFSSKEGKGTAFTIDLPINLVKQ